MNKALTNAKQAGFTLIELVVVIVILGILAATALPRFVNMSADARKATVEGATGAINSASAMAHAQALVKNQAGATGSVTMDGTTVALANGYPTAAAGISAAVSLTGFDAPTVAAGVATFAPTGVKDSTKCNVAYTESTGAAVATTTDCS